MTRQGYKQITLTADFYDEILRWVQARDSRFPSEPTGGDLVKVLFRIAKREARTMRSTDSESVPDGPVQQENPTSSGDPPLSEKPLVRDDSSYLERQRLETNLLAQKITLERQKQRTEWLKAVRMGKIQPAPRATQSSAARPVGFLCKLHQTVHQDGPCLEVQQIARETGLPVEQVGKGG